MSGVTSFVRAVIAGALFGLLTVGPVALAGNDTAETVARDYLDAISTEGIAASGRFFADTELERIRDGFAEIFDIMDGRTSGPEAPPMDEMLDTMFGVQTLRELRTMPGREFYQNLMGFLETTMGDLGISPSGGSILGSINEGDDLAHVVARVHMSVGDTEVQVVDVISLQREDDQWQVLPSAELDQMVSGMRQQIEMLLDAEDPGTSPDGY